jgi:hypothetical protein
LPIEYPGDDFGTPLKVKRSVAIGIIHEIGQAAIAPKWQKEMLRHVNEKKSVPSDVLEFYTMGDFPVYEEDTLGVKGFSTKETTAAVMKIRDKVNAMTREELDTHNETEYAYNPPDKGFEDYSVGNKDFSKYMNEIEVQWTWGMKFLFQRFTLRSDTASKWRLWPFMQPKVNNRDIDVKVLWDPETTSPTLIDAVFKKQDTGFETQGAYSTLYSVKTASRGDGGVPLEAMVNGTSCRTECDDLQFKNLSATKSKMEDIDQCYFAIIVSSLEASKCDRICKIYLTQSTQGVKRELHIAFKSMDDVNLTMLVVLGRIGDFLFRHFNGLKTLEDWEIFYSYITLNFQKANSGAGVVWETSEVAPANCDDLFWKTKVRLLSMHIVGFADLESQKRTATFSSAMMGIIPVDRLEDSHVRDNKGQIGILNDCKTAFATEGTRDKAFDAVLFRNQAKTVPLTIGLLDGRSISLEGKVQEFFMNYSAHKANSASAAQPRSWREMALHLCTSILVQGAVVPADYSKAFFSVMEEHVKPRKDGSLPDPNPDCGRYIYEWGFACEDAILDTIYSLVDDPYVQDVMPRDNSEAWKTLGGFKSSIKEAFKPMKTIPFNHPSLIPKPEVIHLMSYLILLVGPAEAKISTPLINQGLRNLLEVIKSGGKGVLSPPACEFFVPEEVSEEGNIEYIQSVSKEAKQLMNIHQISN